jgi:DNA-binding GntR family transcriptional regulator
MSRNDTRFRRTYNSLLERYHDVVPGVELPTENKLATELGVSRTVIRSALQHMEECGLVELNGREKTFLRAPQDRDRLFVRDDAPSETELESGFLEWVLRFDVPPGTPLNVAQLSRDFNVTPHALQEFLASLKSYGLVERRPNGGWTLLGFTSQFAIELSELRLVLELDAVHKVLGTPPDHNVWQTLETLRKEHVALSSRIDSDYHEFSKLDERFHGAINSVVRNRFVAQFQRVTSLIFHYHYNWDKRDEKVRNAAAIKEHLAIIDALQSRDENRAIEAARNHLKTSMTTLLSSLKSNNLI